MFVESRCERQFASKHLVPLTFGTDFHGSPEDVPMTLFDSLTYSMCWHNQQANIFTHLAKYYQHVINRLAQSSYV